MDNYGLKPNIRFSTSKMLKVKIIFIKKALKVVEPFKSIHLRIETISSVFVQVKFIFHVSLSMLIRVVNTNVACLVVRDLWLMSAPWPSFVIAFTGSIRKTDSFSMYGLFY